MEAAVLKAALRAQRAEVTEYHIYTRLAELCKDEHNREVLRNIGEEELKHGNYWREKTGVETRPQTFRVWRTVLLARIFGLSFVLKRMEKGENTASKGYRALFDHFPGAKAISEEESAHERQLLAMLDEELLHYVGSIVLGLNDALVELTGALAGFTLALGDTKLISLAGLVTGVSASFSMAASDYLSSKAENKPRAGKSALYTGMAYIITVIILIAPFLLVGHKLIALGLTLTLAVLIILVFNYYIAVAQELNFKRRFVEMTGISLVVAAISFGIGWILKSVLGV